MEKMLLFIFIITFFLFSSEAHAAVIINEFSSASTTEWVELLNTDTGASVSLTNWTIQNGSGSTLKSLSGSVPKQTMLTFTLDSPLTDAGDCLRLVDNNGSTQFAVYYGTGSCGGGGFSLTGSPSSTQTGALINNSWSLDDTPTRGWCNDNTGGCPTIATIVATMSSNGVTSNLADQSDYSRISGLYFEKTGYGRITFLAEMNFTNQEALSWMSSLDSKLNLSSKGQISLDADLIKNLMSTQAQLTMYGLTLSDPEVLVDGAQDTGGVVSSLSYSSGTLTFTAAHFTTFTAREKSSPISSSPGPASPPSCGNLPPLTTPDLFQINRKGNSATLYFTPVNQNSDYYYIAYGTSKNAESHGTQFSQSSYPGVLNYTINHLKPGQRYYFKVRAGNGCSPGNWSNILSSKTSRSYRYEKSINH
jgi:hypothetical protein